MVALAKLGGIVSMRIELVSLSFELPATSETLTDHSTVVSPCETPLNWTSALWPPAIGTVVTAEVSAPSPTSNAIEAASMPESASVTSAISRGVRTCVAVPSAGAMRAIDGLVVSTVAVSIRLVPPSSYVTVMRDPSIAATMSFASSDSAAAKTPNDPVNTPVDRPVSVNSTDIPFGSCVLLTLTECIWMSWAV